MNSTTSNIDAYRQYVAPEPTGSYFKLADGDSAKIRIASECFLYLSEYNGRISTKYAWVIYNQTERLPQVWQASVTSFKAVQALALDEDWGDPTQYSLTIKREGTGKETTYSITPSPKRTEMPREVRELVDNFDLHSLIEGAVPLSRAQEFQAAQEQRRAVPEQEAPTAAGSPKSEDVVITDLDKMQELNIDDIPF